MLPLLALLVIAGASAVAFVVGRATAPREILSNHHRLAMFAVNLRSQDDVLAIMPAEDREYLDRLLADYTDVKTKALPR